jgi:hypothetical protein
LSMFDMVMCVGKQSLRLLHWVWKIVGSKSKFIFTFVTILIQSFLRIHE